MYKTSSVLMVLFLLFLSGCNLIENIENSAKNNEKIDELEAKIVAMQVELNAFKKYHE